MTSYRLRKVSLHHRDIISKQTLHYNAEVSYWYDEFDGGRDITLIDPRRDVRYGISTNEWHISSRGFVDRLRLKIDGNG